MAENHNPSVGITELLIAWSDGSREALDDLIPVVHDDLRRLAASYMQREPAGHPLQPTALVSEAYLRLIDQRRVKWRNRAHFFGVAARVRWTHLPSWRLAVNRHEAAGHPRAICHLDDQYPLPIGR
jgi:DNA-directed RNA polymerase specialized sigma24 family protein